MSRESLCKWEPLAEFRHLKMTAISQELGQPPTLFCDLFFFLGGAGLGIPEIKPIL